MGLELIELVPIFMVFILYFLGMPIVYALFGSTLSLIHISEPTRP